jgi:transcription termination factor NusA
VFEKESDEQPDSTEIDQVSESAKTSDDAEKALEEDDEEVPIDRLSEVPPSIIKNLIKSGFETMAELSVTKKEELVEIEGIDEETATTIIQQAKNQIESTGGV